MEKFYVNKRILANGNEWCRLLESNCMLDNEDASINYFSSKGLRDAWTELEKHFCAETVLSLLSEIDNIYGDGISYEVMVEEINRVVVRYFIKGTEIYEDFVEYVFCGDLQKPVLVYAED
jgi:hypothetical protein